jgi:N-acetylmuramoyl-L-alanine amidase
MKKIIKLLSVALLSTLISIPSYSQQENILKIVRGKIDTVYSPIHYVVGVAAEGSEIYVNDMKVKQYTTGSFGAELHLDPGDNDVEVRVMSDGYEYKEFFSVFLAERSVQEGEELTGDFSRPVVITKDGAYLNYGSGKDRLGGAKINFLAEGIKMELAGIEDNLYKVKLSENRYAYIPKSYAEIMPLGVAPPFSLSSSWSVTNDGERDVVRIALQERQPYVIHRETDPNKLVVDIHGVTCNSNWITQYPDLKTIDYVHLHQKESDVLSVIIYFKEKYSWGYSVDYQGNSLVISLKNTPGVLYSRARSREPFDGLYIGVDAGHGGRYSGAVSPSGINEKDLNLDMALVLKNELEKRGARVVLSRSEDVDVSMKERADLFKKEKVDLMVSVHCNAGGNPLGEMGTSTYYRHIEYRELAETILHRLLEKDVRNFGLIGNFNFSLNAPTEFPSVLVETLFMSSLPEEELLADPGFRREMMLKVVEGLEDYMDKVRKDLK